MKTASTEIERYAYQAEKNRRALAAYYQKRRELGVRTIRLPHKHAYLFRIGRVIGG